MTTGTHPLPRRPASPHSLAPARAAKRPRHEPAPSRPIKVSKPEPRGLTLSSSYRPRNRPRHTADTDATPSPSASRCMSSSSASDSALTPASATLSPSTSLDTCSPTSPSLSQDELNRKADEVIARLTGTTEAIDQKAEEVIARLEREAKTRVDQPSGAHIPVRPSISLPLSMPMPMSPMWWVMGMTSQMMPYPPLPGWYNPPPPGWQPSPHPGHTTTMPGSSALDLKPRDPITPPPETSADSIEDVDNTPLSPRL